MASFVCDPEIRQMLLSHRPVRTLARVGRNILYNFVDSPVLVLTYHRVNTLQADPQFLAVTPAHFRAQLEFLKKRFPIVRFGDDWSRVRKASVSITFDDGYGDNALFALPILEELEVPATFFICAGKIDTRHEFWSDEVERIILGEWTFPQSFQLEDSRYASEWATATTGQRHLFYCEMLAAMKKVDVLTRESWLAQLREWAQAGEEGRETNRAMTLEELKSLGKSSWADIGCHTVTHTPLSSLTVPEQRIEIEESKQKLESWLGFPVKVFSYPFGQRGDYTQDSADLCREAGFIKAAANFPGQVHQWTDPYQIPRLVVRNWPLDIFKRHLRRFWIV